MTADFQNLSDSVNVMLLASLRGAQMLMDEADTPLKRAIKGTHYAYLPLFVRSMVNIIRREVLHIIKVPIYEWLCPCKSWHIDRCIQHGYWEQTDMIDFRQIGEFEITLDGPAGRPRRVSEDGALNAMAHNCKKCNCISEMDHIAAYYQGKCHE